MANTMTSQIRNLFKINGTKRGLRTLILSLKNAWSPMNQLLSYSVWCLTGLESGKQVVKRTSVVGHKFLSTKRLVVESLISDIETSTFKALLTYHFLMAIS